MCYIYHWVNRKAILLYFFLLQSCVKNTLWFYERNMKELFVSGRGFTAEFSLTLVQFFNYVSKHAQYEESLQNIPCCVEEMLKRQRMMYGELEKGIGWEETGQYEPKVMQEIEYNFSGPI